MTRIGITGHTNLTPATELLVAAALRNALGSGVDLVGLTCLARGADQVFAEVVLELGGAVEVVLPAADYRQRVVASGDTSRFDRVISRAGAVRTMPFAISGPDAYLAASEQVLSDVDSLLAVWDGDPVGGRGGTADVVSLARARGLPLTVIWPTGAERG
jgi:hypothetical protein